MGGRSTLPPLALTLDSAIPRTPGPSSAPGSDARGPPKRSQSGLVPGTGASTSSTPRTGSPGLNSGTNGERMAERRREELGLGPAPELDWKRAEELVALTEGEFMQLRSSTTTRIISFWHNSALTDFSSSRHIPFLARSTHSAIPSSFTISLSRTSLFNYKLFITPHASFNSSRISLGGRGDVRLYDSGFGNGCFKSTFCRS